MERLLFVFAILTACAATANAEGVPPADTAKILEGIRQEYKLPSLAVVVVKDGEVCDRAAVGLRKLGDPAPITINDQYHIGSCAKSMTATLAAVLIEEGKLRWNTTIGEVFPDLVGKMDKQYESVTVEQLLMHRGGVPQQAPIAAWIKACAEEGTPTQQRYEFIQAVLRNPPQAVPGSKWIYSNQGYAIVGAMLERLTGISWETLMSERLFKPLHMDSAGFGLPATSGQPWGHTRLLGVTMPTDTDNLAPALSPAGGVHCSLGDLARYALAHLQGERNGGLLQAGTFRKLHIAPEGGDYACGWGCVQNPSAGRVLCHAGSNGDWYVFMCLAPEKNLLLIVGTNIGGDRAENGCTAVSREMIKKWLPN
ncbi:MAG: serine hydrolase domain-containing protein [Bacillota bacterium]